MHARRQLIEISPQRETISSPPSVRCCGELLLDPEFTGSDLAPGNLHITGSTEAVSIRSEAWTEGWAHCTYGPNGCEHVRDLRLEGA